MLLLALKIAFALVAPTLLALVVDYVLQRDGRTHADEPSSPRYRPSEER